MPGSAPSILFVSEAEAHVLPVYTQNLVAAISIEPLAVRFS
jgi:hypothetical protein